jgi:deazaflavin-dependent oxidoreductase (nitroreductase family)
MVERNWMDWTRPVWKLGNRWESFLLRRLGTSPMAILNRGDVMVIETVGRRSGRRRFAPVGYWREEDSFVVGGGAAGMATVPDWIKNLRAIPLAHVWVRRERLAVEAQELTGADRDRAQARATDIWSGIPRYEARSGRAIPYFRLVPAHKPRAKH